MELSFSHNMRKRAVITLALLGFALLLCWPAVTNRVCAVVHSNGFPLFESVAEKMLCAIPLAIYCRGDYLTCIKNKMSAEMHPFIYGWENGVASYPVTSTEAGGYHTIPFSFSHSDNMSELPAGVIPTDVLPAVLHLDTSDAEHKKRRTLFVDSLVALQRTEVRMAQPQPPQPPVTQEVMAPPGTGNRDGRNRKKVQDLVGYNLFRWLFGVSLSAEQLSLLREYDGNLAMAVLGLYGNNTKKAARLAEIRAIIETDVFRSAAGRHLIEQATARGMGNGASRLREIVFVAMFAGYGGTGNLAVSTLTHMLSDTSTQLPLYRSDPQAYVIEAARMFPPVAGMNYYRWPQEFNGSLGNGKSVHFPRGSLALLSTSGANRDPAVFGGSATSASERQRCAQLFDPSRGNADRMVTFNNEYRELLKCDSLADCSPAPRGCPGTHLAMRLVKKVVAYFVQGEEEKAQEQQQQRKKQKTEI